MTQHAIFLDREVNVKKAVASSALLPNVAIIDPMLTVSCPPQVTASAGIDAYIHAAEPFLSKNANPITDALALDADQITRWLGPAFADGKNLDARYYMAMGSLMSGNGPQEIRAPAWSMPWPIRWAGSIIPPTA